MSLLIGPVAQVGHPFTNTAYEVPVERHIGGETVYAFGSKWLYTSTEIAPEDPIEAVVMWDPGWLRTDARHEPYQLWHKAQELDVPVIGFFSDWFATWEGGHGFLGARRVVEYLDAIIIDPAGAAAMRGHPLLKVSDPSDHRYRPIVEVDTMLSYGRLPNLGGSTEMVDDVFNLYPWEDRSVDVACVTTRHEAHVVNRSYFQEQMAAVCQDMGVKYVEASKMKTTEMEELYLDSKMVFNHSLGCTLNCRVYEAAAAGAALITDAQNIALEGGFHFTGGRLPVPCYGYLNPTHLMGAVQMLKENPERVKEKAVALNTWVKTTHTPTMVWERNLAAIREAMRQVPKSVRELRRVDA